MIRKLLTLGLLTPLLLTQMALLDTCGSSGEDVTWYRDVLPITQASCETCHREGGIAPFSMETYEEAAPYASAMAAAVQSGYMPPWKPAQDCQTFKDARILSEEEIDTITAWAQQGALEGDPADAPPPPEEEPGLEWVDATLQSAEAYTPNDSEMDDYRCFVLDPGLSEDEYLIGFDIQPDQDFEVHHVLLYGTDMAEAQALDEGEDGPGWTCFGGPGTSSSSVLGAWAPGSIATSFPIDTGIRMVAGNAVVMQIHYNLDNGAPAADQTKADLQYAVAPPLYPASFENLKITDFVIPPLAQGYSASLDYTMPADVTLWGVLPHMHELGQQITVSRTRSGSDECLIDIPDWDFHWQQAYFYETTTGLSVLTGDIIHLTCVWNNDTAQPVTWGESTSDEMCINYFYITQ